MNTFVEMFEAHLRENLVPLPSEKPKPSLVRRVGRRAAGVAGAVAGSALTGMGIARGVLRNGRNFARVVKAGMRHPRAALATSVGILGAGMHAGRKVGEKTFDTLTGGRKYNPKRAPEGFVRRWGRRAAAVMTTGATMTGLSGMGAGKALSYGGGLAAGHITDRILRPKVRESATDRSFHNLLESPRAAGKRFMKKVKQYGDLINKSGRDDLDPMTLAGKTTRARGGLGSAIVRQLRDTRVAY